MAPALQFPCPMEALSQTMPSATRIDLVRLALGLMKTLDVEELLDRALDTLADATPQASWALYIRLGPRRYQVAVRGPMDGDVLRNTIRNTAGYSAWLSVDARLTGDAPQAAARVMTVPAAAIEEGREADLVLASWSDEAIDEHELRTAAEMISSVARSARIFRFMVEQTSRDPLTNVLNRRGILEALEREVGRTDRGGGCLSVLFLDLDHFKPINDQYGHHIGDEVLCDVARRLVRHLRGSDAVGRLGGDEFLVVLPETDELCAAQIAVRLRHLISTQPFETSAGTVSVGVTIGVANAEGTESSRLVETADRRMLAEKRRRPESTHEPFPCR